MQTLKVVVVIRLPSPQKVPFKLHRFGQQRRVLHVIGTCCDLNTTQHPDLDDLPSFMHTLQQKQSLILAMAILYIFTITPSRLEIHCITFIALQKTTNNTPYCNMVNLYARR